MLSEPLATTMTANQLADYIERCDENSNEDFFLLAQVLAAKTKEQSTKLKSICDLVDNISASV